MTNTTLSTALLAVLLLILSEKSMAQVDKYSLLTESFVDRPVSMHKGQLQVNAAYRLSVMNGIFNRTGRISSIQEEGGAAVGHRLDFNARFGIFEILEMGMEMNYLKQGIRETSLNYFDITEMLTVTELTEYKGFEDIALSATLRLPLDIHWFDLGLSGYYALPVSRHEPGKPDHTYESVNDDGSWKTINYRWIEHNGTGVPMYGFGLNFKFRRPKLALAGNGSLMIPQKEGETFFWRSEMIADEFLYQKIGYSFFPQNRFNGALSIHYQITGWFNVFGIGLCHVNSRGWFEQNNQRYAYPENRLYSFLLGFEIQVSTSLRLLQYMGVPLGGANTNADFSIYTGLGYNLIAY